MTVLSSKFSTLLMPVLVTGMLAVGLQAPAHAENAVQRSADRASHDRWARSEPSSAHHSSSSDDDDDDMPVHSKSDTLSADHKGELNGHLSLKGW